MVGKGGDEHAVTHALGTDVIVANVHDIGHVVGGVKTHPLVYGVALKQFAVGVLQQLVCKVGAVARFYEHITRFESFHINSGISRKGNKKVLTLMSQ